LGALERHRPAGHVPPAGTDSGARAHNFALIGRAAAGITPCMRSSQALGTLFSVSLGLLLAASCSQSAPSTGPARGQPVPSASSANSSSASATTGVGLTTTTGGIVNPSSSSSSGGDAGGCLTSCEVIGGTYCGTIGNNCNGILECGDCSGDWVCEQGVCAGGPSCAPSTRCTAGETQYCGLLGDGCGRAIDCGSCSGTDICSSGVCVSPDCVPLTCVSDSIAYCGTLGDGCGGTLECGECPGGTTCGGGGIDNVCPLANCTPLECESVSGAIY